MAGPPRRTRCRFSPVTRWSHASVPPMEDARFVNDGVLTVNNKMARFGCRRIDVQIVTTHPDPFRAVVTIVTSRGPFGWYARRWLARHPATFHCQLFTPTEDWRFYSTEVRVS